LIFLFNFKGLNLANNLDWKNKSRVLVHIADAPAHGIRYYTTAKDSYPEGENKSK